MQGWWFPPHPHSSFQFAWFRRQMKLGNWKWINPKPNQVITPTAASGVDVESLLEQINISPGTYLIWQMPFSLSLCITSAQKHFAFSWQGQQYTFTILPELCINFWALCHNLIQRSWLPFPSIRYHTVPLYWWHYADWTQWVRSNSYPTLVGKTFAC